jgi:hypothetical protein
MTSSGRSGHTLSCWAEEQHTRARCRSGASKIDTATHLNGYKQSKIVEALDQDETDVQDSARRSMTPAQSQEAV